jgi:hypothetical protein
VLCNVRHASAMLSQVVRGDGFILIKHPSINESDSPNKHSANAEQSLCNNAAYKTTAVFMGVQQAQRPTTKHCTQMHVMTLFSLAYIDAQPIGRQVQAPFNNVLPSEAVPLFPGLSTLKMISHFAYSNLISLARRPCERRLLSPVDASLLLCFKLFVITSCADVQLSEAALNIKHTQP